MRILVVEDDEMILRTLEFRLKKEGYSVQAVEDGKQALELLKSEGEQYQLLLTDLMIPFVTGLELVSYAKSELPSLPVVVLSGADEENTVMDAFRIGADDFVAKPFSPEELAIRVKRLIARTSLQAR